MKIYELFTDNKLHLQIDGLLNDTGEELKKIPVCNSLSKITAVLNEKRRKLSDMPVDDIIGIMDAVGRLWDNPEFHLRKVMEELILKMGLCSKEIIELSFKYMCNMYSRAYLQKITDFDLFGNRYVLDEFINLYPETDIVVKAVPRGVAGHWLSGNTLIIGQISLLRAMVTKNASIIKVSSKEKFFIPLFLESFKYVAYTGKAGKGIPGNILTESVAAIFFDSSDNECNTELSMASNIRIARGGRNAIEAIINTKKMYGTEDVIYGPKYSLMVIGRECLTEENARLLAKNAAIDFSVWDQFACTSPHAAYVEKGGAVTAKRFSEILAEEMEGLEKLLPNNTVTVDNAPAIAAARIENEFYGSTYAGDTTSWTVLYRKGLKALPEPLFSRVARVIEVEDIEEVYPLIDKFTQSMGIALKGERKIKFIEKCTYRGIERCVPVGLMHTMLPGSPWDGFFNCDRLMRWVSSFKDDYPEVNKNLIINF